MTGFVLDLRFKKTHFLGRSTSGSSYTIDIRSISASNCSSITYLEHVTIDISFSYTEYRGASEFYLVSPSGTESHLMHYRYDDAIYYASAGSLSWTFMSVHFWRESPIGQWTLKFKSYRGFSVGELVYFIFCKFHD